jgi:hypothetical protein
MKRETMKLAASALACTAALALVGCASYGTSNVRVGQTAQEVQAAMGVPTGRYELPQGGTRLEYARGPMGKHTYMVDLDASGRVTRFDQVLTERHFMTIRPGITTAELLAEFGTPSDRRVVGWHEKTDVWSYRYDSWDCSWYQVSVRDGLVKEASPGPDPLCPMNRKNDV